MSGNIIGRIGNLFGLLRFVVSIAKISRKSVSHEKEKVHAKKLV